jgi:S-adenosylmethionine:tRNA ribosyltransferase-isomerase
MRVDLFDFDLPPDRIALRPAMPRDSAKLLVVQGGELRDRIVSDLPDALRPGDILIFNDTRVIPAQLEGRRGEASIGATLHKREGPREWRAFVRNAKRVRDGDRIDFGNGVSALAGGRGADGSILLRFEGDEPVELLLERAGRVPLRPISQGSARPTSATLRIIRRCSHARREPLQPPRQRFTSRRADGAPGSRQASATRR